MGGWRQLSLHACVSAGMHVRRTCISQHASLSLDTGCTLTPSQFCPAPADTLLGAGSFGRVYKGRWHSSDVAVKIITVRTPEELPKVLHEAEVMMQLDHPNIVRAFHASLWNPTEQVRIQRKHASPRCSITQDCRAWHVAGQL